jgi:protein-tyrosine phosphatase
MLKPFEFSRIDERLLAGRNPLTGADIARLLQEGVTHLLDLREPKEWQSPRFGEEALEAIERNGLVRCHVQIVDGGAPEPEDFERCLTFLAEVWATPSTQVYVHCRAGWERTAVILIAWYAVLENLSYDVVLRRLQEYRPLLQPLHWQEEATRNWLISDSFSSFQQRSKTIGNSL